MTQSPAEVRWGSYESPRQYDSFVDVDRAERAHGRCFTYASDRGVVAGARLNVEFTTTTPSRIAWHCLKDWNLFQNAGGYYYSAAVGDVAEGERVTLGTAPGGVPPLAAYTVTRIIPEHVIVLTQPAPEGDSLVGLGGVSAGFHVVTLETIDGKSTVNFHMEHASVMAEAGDVGQLAVEEALQPWKAGLDVAREKWNNIFIKEFRRTCLDLSM